MQDIDVGMIGDLTAESAKCRALADHKFTSKEGPEENCSDAGVGLTACSDVTKEAADLMVDRDIVDRDAPTPRSAPKTLIDDYLTRNPAIPNHEALAEKIGISRDTLFAIKGEIRWVRAIAYVWTAALIGCLEQDLHPRGVARKRRQRKSNQKSDSRSDE